MNKFNTQSQMSGKSVPSAAFWLDQIKTPMRLWAATLHIALTNKNGLAIEKNTLVYVVLLMSDRILERTNLTLSVNR